MCDTILAAPDTTAAQVMLFGKNSDRQRNEAHVVEQLPSAAHASDARLTCTYITIPQAKKTHAVLLARPFWIWGAEIGSNEHGVAIGNEAVYGRSSPSQDKALTGMDLVRLGLERGGTAAEALAVMTSLLERFGQGGNCGHLEPLYYNNSFIIADPNEAFVLETIGREWLVERVQGVRAISNRLSIERDVHSKSRGLLSLVRDAGWADENQPDYAKVLADPHREHIGNAGARRACSTSLLNARQGKIAVVDMMRILRDHGAGDGYHPGWRAACAIERTLCMHAGAEDRYGQTVGSMVSELREAGSVHWVTGTSAPCISIFKPVWVDVPVPAIGPRPTDRFNPGSLWWRHERLHRAAMLGDFARFEASIRAERDELEANFLERVAKIAGGSAVERSYVASECWTQAIELEERWHRRVELPDGSDTGPVAAAWNKMNQLAGIEWASS